MIWFSEKWIPLLKLLCTFMGAFIFLVAKAEVPNMTPPSEILHEQVLYQPFAIPGGGQQTPKLEVTIYTPEGAGPFPVVIMNHGTPPNHYPRGMPRFRDSYATWYFLSRGYVVVLPMMQGYARSEGQVNSPGCTQVFTGLANARDIGAVLSYMAAQPNIDSRRMLVAGASMGGWHALALGSLHPDGLKGVINFNGGLNVSNCPKNNQTLIEGAAQYATTTLVPSIWIYGENDAIFPPVLWQAMYRSYVGAGGKAQLVDVGAFFKDSHTLLARPEGLPLWTPKADDFLAAIGMPYDLVDARYLPTPFPPASGYANLEDVDAVPYLGESGKKQYQEFLQKDKPRVFLINPKRSLSYNGGFDPLGRALESCKLQNEQCQVYAVNDVVTWVPPMPAPAATHFADIADSGAIPCLKEGDHEESWTNKFEHSDK